MILSGMGAGGAALGAAFLASVVEVVEAFTIILAVGSVRGWKPAAGGAVAGLAALALIVAAFGPSLQLIPIHALQLAIGVLLLLFGMRWLRKAALRRAGVIPQRDELTAFATQRAALVTEASGKSARLDGFAVFAAFKAVLLEGLEVVFIVVAVGGAQGLLWPASLGALAACALVLLAGLALRRPLARVPENALKFIVGVMLSAFGVFWTGEGLGVAWPGDDLALIVFGTIFLLVALLAARTVSRAGLGILSALSRPWRKVTAFFVDDAFLGGATVASVLAAALCRATLTTRPLIAGVLLAGGCFLALTLSVARAARRPA